MAVRNPNKKNEINLLPREEFVASLKGRLLQWILSSFRVIVIVTEIIVMVAFLSRFFLDTKNADLDDEIRQKSALISASLPFEHRFKQVQKHLNIISTFESNKTLTSKTITDIARSVPSDVLLDSIRISEDGVDVSGYAQSEYSIQQLIVNLDTNTELTNITLSKIETEFNKPGQLKFTLISATNKT